MSRNPLLYLAVLVLSMNINACDRVKKKGHSIITRVKDFGDRQADKAFPPYDSYEKDTENNKQRFKDHLQVALTSDVKNIYAYGDFLGIDFKVLIAFTCDDSTMRKIVEVKKMALTSMEHDMGLHFGEEFTWWDKTQLDTIKPYVVGKEYEGWEYLWYNPETRQAFYEVFSL